MIEYGNFVRIKSGFYKGCKGFAIGIEQRDNSNYIEIEIIKIFGGIEVREKTIIEKEKYLEKIEPLKKE